MKKIKKLFKFICKVFKKKRKKDKPHHHHKDKDKHD
jgi:hypothetical protein